MTVDLVATNLYSIKSNADGIDFVNQNSNEWFSGLLLVNL